MHPDVDDVDGTELLLAQSWCIESGSFLDVAGNPLRPLRHVEISMCCQETGGLSTTAD